MDIKNDFYQVNDKLQQMIADELQNAYTKGYEAGYADASNGAPNQLTQPDDFVKALNDTDCYGLGLPSGTMWGVVEGYKVTYDLASKYDIPTETQLYELIACCDLMTLINGIRLSGPKGYLTIHADSAEDVCFWLKRSHGSRGASAAYFNGHEIKIKTVKKDAKLLMLVVTK